MKFIGKSLGKIIATSALFLATASVSHALPYTYATDVRWDNGLNATPSSVANSRYNQASALGSPNANASTNSGFLSLGLHGAAVFDFGVEFNAAAIVFETTNGRANYLTETAAVFVADSSFNFNGLNPGNGLATLPESGFSDHGFTYVGNVTSKTASSVLDLSSLDGPFRYVLLKDITSVGDEAGYDGFDVDAVGVSPVPEPGTMMLLGLGMAGVAIYGKRRKNSKG